MRFSQDFPASRLHVSRFLFFCVAIWITILIFIHLSDIRLSIVRCFYACYPIDVVGAFGGTYVIYLLSRQLLNCHLISSIVEWFGRNSIVFLCIHTIDLDLRIRQMFGINGVLSALLFTVLLCSVTTIFFGCFPSISKLLRIYRFEMRN